MVTLAVWACGVAGLTHHTGVGVILPEVALDDEYFARVDYDRGGSRDRHVVEHVIGFGQFLALNTMLYFD
ncbi:hypothetical protein GCM10010522_31400 [Kribbella solani]